MMPSRSLSVIKEGNVMGNMADLGFSAKTFLLLLQHYNLFSHACQSFLPLAVTYMEVTYEETSYLVTYMETSYLATYAEVI
jgi:hypothetical protein